MNEPTILQGDVRETLKTLPSDSVHCVVTSPPYWALRSYLPNQHPLKPLEIGSEATLEQYLITMVLVFREIRRVLHPSGTLWLNIGSTYASASTRSILARRSQNDPACGTGGKEPQDSLRHDCACHGHDDECQGDLQTRRDRIGRTGQPGARSDALAVQTIHDNAPTDSASVAAPSHVAQPSTIPASTGNDPGASCPEGIALEPRTAVGSSPDDVPPSADTGQHTGDTLSQLRTLVDRIEDRKPLELAFAYCSIVSRGIKEKDLLNVPSMLAEALRLDGWFIRSDIAWCKKSPMPESVTDRPTSAWEHIWLLTKSARYFYDANAVRVPAKAPAVEEARSGMRNSDMEKLGTTRGNGNPSCSNPNGANLRNFWLLGPEPYSEAHFATYPTEIPRRAILAGTSARGCCPKCLAPWERVVETEFKRQPDVSAAKGIRSAGTQKPMDESNGWEGFPRGTTQTRTIGWRPTCECDAGEPEPCLVLDPFTGSGTTCAVALELGRSVIGIELNPGYLELARARCARVTPGLQLA